MVYQQYSTDLKQKALEMYLSRGWSLNEVVDVFGMSRQSLKRWEANYLEHGHVEAPRLPAGRPRILTASQLEELESIVQQDPTLYLDEIMQHFALHQDTFISLPALCNNLRDLSLDRKVLRVIAAQRDEGLCTAWFDYVAQAFTAAQMVFIDESSKDGRTLARRYGRSYSGETPEIRMNHDRGDRYSILPALTLDGYISLRVVAGSVDGEELYDFVINDLLPKMNAFPNDRSVLVLDNCNTHKSDALRLAVEGNGSVLLFLPPYSPHFNPIEESFACLKDYLRRHWHTLEDAFDPIAAIMEAAYEVITPEKARGWIRHSGYL